MKQLHGTTMTEAARAVGLHYQTYYAAVYRRRIIPRPKTHAGRRYYYSPEELARVLVKVQELKNVGEI